MNMEYRKGQIVGYVPLNEGLAVPSTPQGWYVLRVMPGRDARVMRDFERLGISGWSPMLVRYIDRQTGREARKPHLGRRVEKLAIEDILALIGLWVVLAGKMTRNPEINPVESVTRKALKDRRPIFRRVLGLVSPNCQRICRAIRELR